MSGSGSFFPMVFTSCPKHKHKLSADAPTGYPHLIEILGPMSDTINLRFADGIVTLLHRLDCGLLETFLNFNQVSTFELDIVPRYWGQPLHIERRGATVVVRGQRVADAPKIRVNHLGVQLDLSDPSMAVDITATIEPNGKWGIDKARRLLWNTIPPALKGFDQVKLGQEFAQAVWNNKYWFGLRAFELKINNVPQQVPAGVVITG